MKNVTLSIVAAVIALSAMFVNMPESQAGYKLVFQNGKYVLVFVKDGNDSKPEKPKPERYEVGIYRVTGGGVYQSSIVNSYEQAVNLRNSYQRRWWKTWEVPFEKGVKSKLFFSYDQAKKYNPRGADIKNQEFQAQAFIRKLN